MLICWMQVSLAASAFGEAEGYPFAFMHCWDIMKDEPKWQPMKHNTAAQHISSPVPIDPCHTPVLGNRTEASIRVPRMIKSHVRSIIW
jgi:hypothetical protein